MNKIKWYFSKDRSPLNIQNKYFVIYYIHIDGYHQNFHQNFIELGKAKFSSDIYNGNNYLNIELSQSKYGNSRYTIRELNRELKYGFYWTHISDTVLANDNLLYSIYQDGSIEDKLRKIGERIITENRIKSTLL